MMKRGDIVLLSFPFTNLRTTKVRPAMVVSGDAFNKTSHDAIFLFITSREYSGAFDLRLSNRDGSFRTTGLKTDSTFRISKIMCLEQRLARRRLGRADDDLLGRVHERLKDLFDIA